MKWTFICTGLPPFNSNTASLKTLGGTESSCCYLMNELVNLKQEVEFFCQGGVSSMIDNIKHFALDNFEELEQINSDICIFLGHTADIVTIKKIIKNIPLIFWAHHSYDQQAVKFMKDLGTIKSLLGIIFISNWQELSFINHFKLSNIKTFVIGHGVTPNFINLFLNFNDFKKKKTENIGIYASAPYRGLEVLYESSFFFKEKIIIDIFSSMKMYSMEDREEFINLFGKIKNNNNFNYFGSVDKKTLSKYFSYASFLTYPSIFEETFCITLQDALAAGLEPIITNLGALDETSLGYGKLITLDNNNFIKKYADLVNQTLKDKNKNFDEWCNKQYKQMINVNLNHSWPKKAQLWLNIAKNF